MAESVKVYDPRLDTEPGAHPDDRRFYVNTTNPMLLMTDYERAMGSTVNWPIVVKMADVCDATIEAPDIVDQGGSRKPDQREDLSRRLSSRK
jgi:hypothetical protein